MIQPTLSVVVAGSMNPAIHHPFWYAAMGMLTDAEARAASMGAVVIPQQFSQFHTPRFKVECLVDRWAIIGLNPAATDEVLRVAGKTFDKLGETPLTAFGLNFDHSGRLRSGAGPFDVLREQLGIAEFTASQFLFSRPLQEIDLPPLRVARSLNVALELRSDVEVILHTNVNHSLGVIEATAIANFEFTPTLTAAVGLAQESVLALVQSIFGDA